MRAHPRRPGLPGFALLFVSRLAFAQPAAPPALPTPLPEPLVGESITDIDGTAAGELELESDVVLLRQAGGASGTGFDLEAEWRATPRLGVAVEAGAGKAGGGEVELSALETGLSYSLLHDAARDLHVQAEVSARLFEESGDEGEVEGPLELPRPVAACVRAALRSGPLTFRGAAGIAAGGGVSGLVQLAILRALGGVSSRSFCGIEVGSTIGSGAPLWVVPQVFASVPVFGLPVRIGLGIPWVPALRSGQKSTCGGMLRLVVPLDAD